MTNLGTAARPVFRAAVFLASYLSLVHCAAVSAGIVGQTGAINTTAPHPPRLLFDDLESDTQMWVWQEQEDLELPADLHLDITEDGICARNDDLSPGIIPAGTHINSYLFHFDRDEVTILYLEGSITFAEDIVGIIALYDPLRESDYVLGTLEASAYSTNPDRQIELLPQDYITLAGSTLWLDMCASNAIDEMRIITVPEPAALSLLALGGLALLRRRSPAAH